MSDAGLAVADPRDVTATECGRIGCVAEIDTDTVTVTQFPNTGSAQRFAGQRPDSYVVENLVLVFSSDVAADARRRYERVVADLL